MARLIGPLFSHDARGLYGGISVGVVYSAWREWRYARKYVLPANPRTLLQGRNRSVVRGVSEMWGTFNNSQKEYWDLAGALLPHPLPGFTACVGYNLRNAHVGWGLQMEENMQHLETPDAPVDLDAQVVDNAIVVTWTDVASPYSVGIHAGASAGFSPQMSNVQFVTLSVDGAERQCTILLAAGTYYMKARGYGQDGGPGTPSTAVGPLVIG